MTYVLHCIVKFLNYVKFLNTAHFRARCFAVLKSCLSEFVLSPKARSVFEIAIAMLVEQSLSSFQSVCSTDCLVTLFSQLYVLAPARS